MTSITSFSFSSHKPFGPQLHRSTIVFLAHTVGPNSTTFTPFGLCYEPFGLCLLLDLIVRSVSVYRLEKQPIAQPVNEAREEVEDHDAISILTSRLNKLRKGPVEMLWELRTSGLECHVSLYINFDDAYEIIGGEKMLNISCIQLWCMYTDTIVVESGRAKIKAEMKSLIQTLEFIDHRVVTRTIVPKRFNTTSSLSTSVIKTIREDWARYLNKHFK
ncbi:hypothetical protein LR48_Vigan10g147200 [Vigna angularis]|uniref:Uncharacterized protein n=1 Tax=Phaseolus angularis TaxID=3914 RepID=A0A0L9VKK6_PHAAN|nr:hypothetical protein LR48_Vigan10g147200 [Vigna angularis]